MYAILINIFFVYQNMIEKEIRILERTSKKSNKKYCYNPVFLVESKKFEGLKKK